MANTIKITNNRAAAILAPLAVRDGVPGAFLTLTPGVNDVALDVWLDDPLYEGLRRHDDLFEEVRNIVLDYGAAHWLGRVTNRWSDPDPFPRLEELQQPALVVTGSLEIPSFKAMADAYVKGLPTARREELEDVGHLVNIEAADAFNEHLRDFVRHVEKG